MNSFGRALSIFFGYSVDRAGLLIPLLSLHEQPTNKEQKRGASATESRYLRKAMKLRTVRSVPVVRPSKAQSQQPDWDAIYAAQSEEDLGRYGY